MITKLIEDVSITSHTENIHPLYFYNVNNAKKLALETESSASSRK